ncbi:hypothetical protein VP1G_03651 [Cytospora mali]|uniref:DUF7704 domain-containing protein n=1 Tax=Cytospora mali TaxID=578113 RepID=A0A194UWY9_CYTMA|nr:hypothetical protein VP1G_03651 [Valsa mali var. pyri (nom. inval.)]
MAPQQQAAQQQAGFSLPLPYRIFFLLIEPISALVGAFYAHFRQREYLLLTHAASAPIFSPMPTGTSIVLSQLANLYLLFALNEAIVLRFTSDLRVWKAMLFVLLLADLGHLWSLKELGFEIYAPWNYARWNAIDWGNIPFVYFGAVMRLAFLADIGMPRTAAKVTKPKRG